MNAKTTSILWRRLDEPGHEVAHLVADVYEQQLKGVALFREDGKPCRLDYEINLRYKWHTLFGVITGWVGTKAVHVNVFKDDDQKWYVNNVEYPDVQGCVDLDLSFSSATNVIPLNRLTFAIGEEHEVVSAWLIFPEFKLQPLRQLYRRVDENRYHYWADNGFETELTVNKAGFVTNYPPLWTEEK